MSLVEKIALALNEAKLVLTKELDNETLLIFVWHGGHTVNIYDENFTEIDMFTLGWKKEKPSEKEVEDAIDTHLDFLLEGEEPEEEE